VGHGELAELIRPVARAGHTARRAVRDQAARVEVTLAAEGRAAVFEDLAHARRGEAAGDQAASRSTRASWATKGSWHTTVSSAGPILLT
jgi:hypothetical protein